MKPSGARARRHLRRRRVLLAGAAALVLLALGAAYVAIPVASDLGHANDVLTGPARDLGVGDIEEARDRLLSAEQRLDGVVASVIRLLPVARQSLGAVDEVVDAALPAVDAAAELRAALDSLVEADLVTAGQVRLDELLPVGEELRRQSHALASLEDVSDDSLGSWVLPPVWERLSQLSVTAGDLARGVGDAGALVEALPGILGEEGPRRYLLLLLNNAELRGAGGILSGLGTLRAVSGRLVLEQLVPREALVTNPLVEVEAPAPLEHLYGPMQANTTLWVNLPYSPDLEHTAAVAAALWEETQGRSVSGVIFADPRGLAALLEPETTLPIGPEGTDVTAAELPEFVYSGAYQAFESQSERRAAILEAGAAAFDAFLATGGDGEEGIRALGDAAAGGHLSFVSMLPDEQAALRNVTSAHTDPRDVRVVVQNLGDGRSAGTKLDYWVERDLRQECRVEDDGSATCATRVSFENTVPDGLGRYVGGRPYGMLRSSVQTFLPKGTSVTDAFRDGEGVEAIVDSYGASPVVSVNVRAPQGETVSVEILYEVPPRAEGDFKLELVPQPLARDASIETALSLPSDWQATGVGTSHEGTFDRPLTLAAVRPERKGLAALWQRLTRFWDEPLF